MLVNIWRNRKTIGCALLLIFALVMVLPGCSSSSGSKDSQGSQEPQKVAYPTKTIEIICPWGAGGGTDVAIRGFAKFMEKHAGVTVIVRNVTGGAGTIGWTEGKNAYPDGYKLSLLTYDIIPAEVSKLAEISYKDFEKIGTFTLQPLVMGVRGDKPWKTPKEVAEAAKKAGPGGLKTGTQILSWAHLVSQLYQDAEGIEFTVVPHDGFGEAVRATLGGHEDVLFGTPPSYKQYDISQLKPEEALRPLAITSAERSDMLPDVPTFKELGYNIEFQSFRTIAAPKGTPPEILDKLAEIVKAAYDDPEFQKWAKEADIEIGYLNGEDSAKLMDSMLADSKPLIEKLSQKYQAK